MRPETLLAKFGLKGINYAQSGGKGQFSLEEQLAMVGVSWGESPVGFLVLFTEVHGDFQSRQLLEKAVMLELIAITSSQRGQKSQVAFNAMAKAAIAEATNPLGQVCPSCHGSGLYTTERRQKRKCTLCSEGRIEWDAHSRYAELCSHQFRCTFSCYKRKYLPIIECLTKWLADKRNAAVLALMETIEREKAA